MIFLICSALSNMSFLESLFDLYIAVGLKANLEYLFLNIKNTLVLLSLYN